MVNLSISGDSIVFEFINSNYYLQNGKIATPINSLALITDESNIATFKKASSNDIFVAATYDELGKTKAELIEWFKDNAVGATGGGGDLDDYYTKEQTDALLDEKADTSAITEALTAKLNVSDFNTYSGNINTAITSIEGDITDVQTALQGKASQSDLTALETVVGTKASETDLQALESVVGGKLNTSDFNTYSANVNTELASKASNADLNTLSGVVDTKADKTEIPDVSNYIDNVDYDSANHLIKFFHNQTLIDSVDATDFIKDGMVSNVEIVNGKLVISFNTDAGKEDIEIPLTDIFNPNNYYDKTATDALLDAKLNVSDFNTYSSATQTAIQGKANASDLQALEVVVGTKANATDLDSLANTVNGKVDLSTYTAYTSSTETTINGKASQTDLNTVSGNVDTLSGDMANKVDVSAYTAYTSATDTALQGKANTSDLANYVEVTAYTAYTSATDTALSGKASQTDLNTVSGSVANKQDLLVSGTNIKTVNGNSLLGSGNITIEGGQTVTSVTQAEYDALVTKDPDTFYIISDATGSTITIDPSLNSGSTNAVANSAITIAIDTVSAATASNTTALGGYKLWKGTQAQYDAIVTKDEDTIYFIVNNS